MTDLRSPVTPASRTCANQACGLPFTPVRAFRRSRFCSAKCRWSAWQQSRLAPTIGQECVATHSQPSEGPPSTATEASTQALTAARADSYADGVREGWRLAAELVRAEAMRETGALYDALRDLERQLRRGGRPSPRIAWVSSTKPVAWRFRA